MLLARTGAFASKRTDRTSVQIAGANRRTDGDIAVNVGDQVQISGANRRTDGAISLTVPDVIQVAGANRRTDGGVMVYQVPEIVVAGANRRTAGTVIVGGAIDILLSELSAAAVSAGGSGLANWAIWLGDAYSGSTATNQGSLGGNLTGQSSIAADATALNGRAGWNLNGTSEFLADASNTFADNFESATQDISIFSVARRATGATSAFRSLFAMAGNTSTNANQEDYYYVGITDGNKNLSTYREWNGSTTTNVSATSTANINTNTLYALSYVRNGNTDTRNYIAGSLDGSASLSAAANLSLYYTAVGALRRLSTDARLLYWSGDIYIMAVCNLDLNSASSGAFDTARERVEAAINTYYGL